MSESNAHKRLSLRRILLLVLVFLIAPLLIIPTGIGFVGMWFITHAPCGDPGLTPQSFGLAYTDISIPARSGGIYRGFFIPGAGSDAARKAGTIIVPPAFNGGRSGMYYEAIPLAQSGYNVLMYESRTCAGRPLSLGYRDVEDIGDVLVFLQNGGTGIPRAQSGEARIALHGFSSAGAASIMAAARYPEIRGVLAEGGYHNLSAFIGLARARNVMESLLLFGVNFSYQVATGDSASVLDPIGVIDRIPPRMVFLIYGSAEVTLDGAREKMNMLHAAEPTDPAAPNVRAALWVVPNADHGGYIYAAGTDEYMRQALAFYDCALLDRCAAWNANWATR